ncbi:hypothetical protein [Filimonas effusa]|uniref:Uncharacterized protein n=1 Tax=Filimonas effusa TaxID=2508721 RepID=A0A4Q1D3C9_9BACT|nr:hypothetical protein [Filimonas effusa]RXK82920.1 hypothetical protein ESB13_12390 [Filimonas effusa]
MISQKEIAKLLKKTKAGLVSKDDICQVLQMDNKAADDVLSCLEKQGLLEKSEVNGLWQQTIRGNLLSIKKYNKYYRVETLRAHLAGFLERVQLVNASGEYPDYIVCVKMISEYPIENRSNGIKIAYSLRRKEMSSEAYRKATDKLLRKSGRYLGNMVAELFYSHQAIREFLKFRSHALKLTKYEQNEMEQISGCTIFSAHT